MRRPDGCCCGDETWDQKSDAQVNAMYSSCSVICIKSCSLTVVLACIAALVLSVLGTGLAVSSFGLLFDNVNSIFAWALGKIDFIQAEMTVSDINGNPHVGSSAHQRHVSEREKTS